MTLNSDSIQQFGYIALNSKEYEEPRTWEIPELRTPLTDIEVILHTQVNEPCSSSLSNFYQFCWVIRNDHQG